MASWMSTTLVDVLVVCEQRSSRCQAKPHIYNIATIIAVVRTAYNSPQSLPPKSSFLPFLVPSRLTSQKPIENRDSSASGFRMQNVGRKAQPSLQSHTKNTSRIPRIATILAALFPCSYGESLWLCASTAPTTSPLSLLALHNSYPDGGSRTWLAGQRTRT